MSVQSGCQNCSVLNHFLNNFAKMLEYRTVLAAIMPVLLTRIRPVVSQMYIKSKYKQDHDEIDESYQVVELVSYE